MYNVEKTRKRKLTGEDDSMPTPKKRGRPKKIINLESRYPPVRPQEGSDSTADARNMQALQLETEKDKPRKEVVLPLMKATFYSRRHYILNEAESVVKVLERFPSLKMPSVVRWFVYVCVCSCTHVFMCGHGWVCSRVCVCVCGCVPNCVSVCENITHFLWVVFAIVKFIIVNVSKVTEVHVAVHVYMLILPD